MNKRERLERAIAGEPVDRVPVALWRHWPGDDQRAADFAASTIWFQRHYDWDFVKVTPASSFCLVDYGVQDEWAGDPEGTRRYTRRVIKRSLDWTELKVLDPKKGGLGRQIQVLNLLKEALGDEVPYIQTIFSPLAQAKNLAGPDQLLRHMRRRPDRLHTALNTITESTMRFLDAMRRTGISGIFYAVQHADYGIMSEAEYNEFGRPYDLRILELAGRWWFNVLHIHGDAPMFRLLADYPVQVINWHTHGEGPDLAEGQAYFNGAVCGGLQRRDVLLLGTPHEILAQAHEAIAQTYGRRFILSADCVIPVTTPISNIRAAREAVEKG